MFGYLTYYQMSGYLGNFTVNVLHFYVADHEVTNY